MYGPNKAHAEMHLVHDDVCQANQRLAGCGWHPLGGVFALQPNHPLKARLADQVAVPQASLESGFCESHREPQHGGRLYRSRVLARAGGSGVHGGGQDRPLGGEQLVEVGADPAGVLPRDAAHDPRGRPPAARRRPPPCRLLLSSLRAEPII